MLYILLSVCLFVCLMGKGSIRYREERASGLCEVRQMKNIFIEKRKKKKTQNERTKTDRKKN